MSKLTNSELKPPVNRYALIISVGKYRFLPDIDKAAERASDFGNFLSYSYGFQTHLLVDNKISRPSVIFDEVTKLSSASNEQDQVFIYYIGHGITLIRKGITRGFLSIPTTVPGRPRTGIDLGRLLSLLHTIPAKQKLIIINSNFGNISVETDDSIEFMRFDSIATSPLQVIIAGNDFKGKTQGGQNNDHLSISNLIEHKLREHKDIQKTLSGNLLAGFLNQEISRRTKGKWQPIFGFSSNNKEEFEFSGYRRHLKLPSYLVKDLYDLNPGSRQDAINELAHMINNPHPEIAQIALEKLFYVSREDTDFSVRQAASKALRSNDNRSLLSLKHITKLVESKIKPTSTHRYAPEMILVPEGDFLMGSDYKVSEIYDKPMHPVHLPNYSISKTHITNMLYAHFVMSTDHAPPDHWESEHVLERLCNHPVVMVSWYDAIAYCKWLTLKLRGTREINLDQVVRLPTEAEWEKAARGEDGRLYPWGNDFVPMLCNYEGSNIDTTTSVGSYSPKGDSPYGCIDMAGNAWGWTSSLWGKGGHFPKYKYPYICNDGREDLIANSSYRRIMRGGGFYYKSNCVTCVTRNRGYPQDKHPGGSFRIVIAKDNGESI